VASFAFPPPRFAHNFPEIRKVGTDITCRYSLIYFVIKQYWLSVRKTGKNNVLVTCRYLWKKIIGIPENRKKHFADNMDDFLFIFLATISC